MELREYKLKRDERVKFLYKSGETITYIIGAWAIDERLIRSIIGNMPERKRGLRATKSLKINDPWWQ